MSGYEYDYNQNCGKCGGSGGGPGPWECPVCRGTGVALSDADELVDPDYEYELHRDMEMIYNEQR